MQIKEEGQLSLTKKTHPNQQHFDNLIIEGKVLIKVKKPELMEGCFECPEGIQTIGKDAFVKCEKLKQVILPDSITSIGDCAFYNCWNLTQINLPDSLTKMGKFVFFGCSNLTQISLPKNITVIPKNAFTFSGLNSIFVPENVLTIHQDAFAYCTELTSVFVSKNVTSINLGAFHHCYRLTHIHLPKKIETIGKVVFNGNSVLQHIIITDGSDDDLQRIGNFLPDDFDKVVSSKYFEDWKINTQFALTESGLNNDVTQLIVHKGLELQFFKKLLEKNSESSNENQVQNNCQPRLF